MLTGHYPFMGRDAFELFAQIATKNINDKSLKHISKPGRDFVKALLTKNPAKRSRIKDLLHHPWLLTYHIEFCRFNSTEVDPKLFERIIAVSKINAFGIQLLKILITFFPKPKDYPSAVKAFFNADYSLTGFITPKGLVNLFHEHGEKLTDTNLNSIMECLALFEEGFITFTEFIVAAINKYEWLIGQNLIPQLFSFLDVDESSFVTIENLTELFKRFGYLINKSYIEDMVTFLGNDVLLYGFNLQTFEKFIHSAFSLD